MFPTFLSKDFKITKVNMFTEINEFCVTLSCGRKEEMIVTESRKVRWD